MSPQRVYNVRVALRSPNLAVYNLKRVEPDQDGAKVGFFQRIVCTGTEVCQFDADTKTITVYPAGPRRLTTLEQWLLPRDSWSTRLASDLKSSSERAGVAGFLRPESVRQLKHQYRIELVAESGKSYRLRLEPTDAFRESVARVMIDLNRETDLPDALQFRLAGGKQTITLVFTSIRPESTPNGPPAIAGNGASQFKAIDGWKVVRLDQAGRAEKGPEEPPGAGPPAP